LESFVRSVRTGTPPAVSGEEGVAAVALAHRILSAIASFIQRQVDHEAAVERSTEGPAIV
ncbi:MAG: hypothetical protein NNA23_03795, partial [Nitrospira sp.]|nr:hypothetical protein [Nitrospira sp.]